VTNTASGTVAPNSGNQDAVHASITSANPTLVNQGTLIGSGIFYGVYFADGGYVNNSGLIKGALGIFITNPGTVINSGTITGTGTPISQGVFLQSGGNITNTTSGQIQGFGGVYLLGGGTITNFGTIVGTLSRGICLGSGGTVTNAGTISGGNGTAVDFASGNGNRLIVDPGAVFTGIVNAGTGSVLEMASAAVKPWRFESKIRRRCAIRSSALWETASAAARASSTTCPGCAGSRTPRRSLPD